MKAVFLITVTALAMLAELLRRRGVTELEAAYLTRPRRDAVAGLPALLRTLPVMLWCRNRMSLAPLFAIWFTA